MIRGDGGYLEPESQHSIEPTRKERTRKIFRGFLKGLVEFLYILIIVIGYSIGFAFAIHPIVGLIVAGFLLIGPIYVLYVFFSIPMIPAIVIWTLVVISSIVVFITKKVKKAKDRKEMNKLKQEKLKMIREEARKYNEEAEKEPMDFEGFMASWEYFDNEKRIGELKPSNMKNPRMVQPVPETPDEYYSKRWGGAYLINDNKG